MKFRVWVEAFTTQRFTEEIVEVPDDQWAAWTPAGREAYMRGVYDVTLSSVADGGFEKIEE